MQTLITMIGSYTAEGHSLSDVVAKTTSSLKRANNLIHNHKENIAKIGLKGCCYFYMSLTG